MKFSFLFCEGEKKEQKKNKNMLSNRAVVVQRFDTENLDAGLALVTKLVPEAEPGHVVVHITLRPVHPTDLNIKGYSTWTSGSFTPGAEGFGIVHEVVISIMSFRPFGCKLGHSKGLALVVAFSQLLLFSLLWNQS